MADTNLKVQIKFQATGDKELARAFKTAAIANEKLGKAVEKNEKLQDKLNKTNLLGVRNNRLLANTFATIRSKLLLASFAFTLVTGSVGKFIQKSAEFEKVKVRLNAMFGSVDKGTQAFNRFNKIAATTPFTLEDVVEAGAALKAFGVDAENLIKPVSDLAAFMGTTASEAASALGRAFAGGAGAADILRERGILQLVRDSQGIEDLTKLTLPQFREALEKTITDPSVGVAGATEQLSKTMSGLFSNLADSFSRLSAAIGDIATGSVFRNTVEGLTTLFGKAAEALTKFNETDQESFLRLLSEFAEADNIQRFRESFEEVPTAVESLGKALNGTEKDIDAFIKSSNILFDEKFLKVFSEAIAPTVAGVTKGQTFSSQLIGSIIDEGSPEDIERLRKFVDSIRQEIDIQRMLIESFGGVDDVPQLELLKSIQENVLSPIQNLLPKALEDAKPIPLDIEDFITFDDEDDNSFAAKFASREAQDRSELAAALMETANLVQESEKLIIDAREELFNTHFNKILDLATQNINQRKERELQSLRDTEEFRNASAEKRADMEKDALKKFKDQEKAIFRLNQAVEIAKVVMSTKSAVAQLTAVMAQISAQAALLAANPITAPFAKKALAQLPTLGATIAALRASSGIQIAGIAAQQPPAFARGGSFITGGQQMIMVGDNPGGRERVDITPLSSPDFGDAGGGGSINVNIMGNVIGTQEFVRDNLLPEIENSIRRNLA
mgnify:CR=1 FL=1